MADTSHLKQLVADRAKYDADILAEVQRLNNQGVHFQDLAAMVGVSRPTLRKRLKAEQQ